MYRDLAKRRATRKEYRKNNLESFLLNAARSRSKKKNLEFNLELSDVIIPKFCPLLNIPLYKNSIKVSNNSPSLDRIDNSKGYIKGNVVVISYLANVIKNQANSEMIIMLGKNLRKLEN